MDTSQGQSRKSLWTTFQGGSYDFGTVFEVTAKGKETVLHSSPDNTMDGGHANEQSLAIDGKGNLYGTTETGGTYVRASRRSCCTTLVARVGTASFRLG